MKNTSYDIIVIGASYGGIDALTYLMSYLSDKINIPVVVVQHIKYSEHSNLAMLLSQHANKTVKEADERETIQNNTIYIAPAGYHLYIEEKKQFALSMDNLVQFSRPSIDVLFESAANAYQNKTIAILLTGANNDGAMGMLAVHKKGGITIAQEPKDAQMATMPQSAIDLFNVDYIEPLERIPACLTAIIGGEQ